MKINDLLLEYSRSRSAIVVDVQPAYSGIMDGDENPVFEEIMQFVNNQTGHVLMFVNAEDQGMTGDTVQDIKVYWEDTIRGEEWDPEEYDEAPIDWNRFQIVDKGDTDISEVGMIRVSVPTQSSKPLDSCIKTV